MSLKSSSQFTRNDHLSIIKYHENSLRVKKAGREKRGKHLMGQLNKLVCAIAITGKLFIGKESNCKRDDRMGGGRCGGVKTNTKRKATFEFNHSCQFFNDHSFLNLRYLKKINDILIHD